MEARLPVGAGGLAERAEAHAGGGLERGHVGAGVVGVGGVGKEHIVHVGRALLEQRSERGAEERAALVGAGRIEEEHEGVAAGPDLAEDEIAGERGQGEIAGQCARQRARLAGIEGGPGGMIGGAGRRKLHAVGDADAAAPRLALAGLAAASSSAPPLPAAPPPDPPPPEPLQATSSNPTHRKRMSADMA